MSLRDTLRSLTPQFILEWNRNRKKNKVRAELKQQESTGTGWTKLDLIVQFKNAGLVAGDKVLVHSALSKIGFIQGGPVTFIEAILEVIGNEGTLLMPTSPNGGYQLDYIKELTVFDINNSPSALGKITEVFRTMPGVLRSASPTEPVAAFGPNAAWLTEGHLGEMTPYTENSPFARLAEIGGKILYVGVTLDNAGTSLHVLEDAVPNFKFPVYYSEVFQKKVRLANGEEHEVRVKVHNPEQSALRKCDKLLPLFFESGCYHEATIGKAKTLVFDAKKMLAVMIEGYHKSGITMYTPAGSE